MPWAYVSLAGDSKSTAPLKRVSHCKVQQSQRDRRGASQRKKETYRDRESERWSLTHLVGQGHKRRCLPGVQWSMKPPGECNRRALEPPYMLLTNQPTNSLKGSELTKAAGCSDLPSARCQDANKGARWDPSTEPAVWFSFWSVPIEILSHEKRRGEERRGEGLGYEVTRQVWANSH